MRIESRFSILHRLLFNKLIRSNRIHIAQIGRFTTWGSWSCDESRERSSAYRYPLNPGPTLGLVTSSPTTHFRLKPGWFFHTLLLCNLFLADRFMW